MVRREQDKYRRLHSRWLDTKQNIYKLIFALVLALGLLFPILSIAAAPVEVELLSESFEAVKWEWTNWESTLWYRYFDAGGSVNDTYSAGARYDTPAWDGPITSIPLNASDAESIKVVFFFSTRELESGDFNLYYWDGAGYVLQEDLTTYGAISPTWVKYSEIITDSTYLIEDFRIQLEVITEVNEEAWLDGVRITKTLPGDHILSLYTVGGGTLEAAPVGPYSEDTEVTLTATPETGWAFAGWGWALSGTDNPETLMVDGDKTVVAYFTSSGIIDVSVSDTSVDRGSTITSTISGGTTDGELMIQYERSGQMVWADQVTLDGSGATSYPIKIPDNWIDGTYTVRVKDVDSGTIDAVSFDIPVPSVTWTITASAGAGGSISPDGASVVADGGDQSYTITPNSGYHILGVLVDSVPQGVVVLFHGGT